MIRYKDFGLVPTEWGFDLVRFVKSRRVGDGTIREPKGEEYEKQVDIGYGYNFESAVKKISHLHSIDGLPQDPTLRDYIDNYKKSVEDIYKVLGKLP